MMVELDVYNKDGSLASSMYPTIDWPVVVGENLLFVPATSVVTTTERTTFVIVSVNGRAHWVDVRKGPAAGETFLSEGKSLSVRRSSSELLTRSAKGRRSDS
jgi:membrane fusion protein, multidrug efflux system